MFRSNFPDLDVSFLGLWKKVKLIERTNSGFGLHFEVWKVRRSSERCHRFVFDPEPEGGKKKDKMGLQFSKKSPLRLFSFADPYCSNVVECMFRFDWQNLKLWKQLRLDWRDKSGSLGGARRKQITSSLRVLSWTWQKRKSKFVGYFFVRISSHSHIFSFGYF